jgi:4-hydroxybenzoate polyprenyltransferase
MQYPNVAQPSTAAKAYTGSVLCVDLDGSLISTDTLVETLFLFVRHFPFRLFLLPVWLLRGRAFLKMRLAEAVQLPVETLPYNSALLRYIGEQRADGVRVVLATGADHSIAARVAAHLSLFDEIWSSDGTRNLVGRHKANLLAENYPEFEYAGNSRTDLPVWLRSRGAIVVSSSIKLLKILEQHSIPAKVMGGNTAFRLSTWLRVMRVYQWVKNLLVFLPLVTSHRLTDWRALGRAAIAFLAVSLAASGTYLINDLFDLQADRAHGRKKQRPFAAGLLDPVAGVLVAFTLLASSLAVVWALSPATRLLLAGYVVLTLSYSLRLKRFLVVDILLLVCFYLLRIFVGGMATGISISVWLLSFSMFFFLALALVKRLTELRAVSHGSGGEWTTSVRGYQREDVQLLGSLAGSSAYLSVVLLALYINSPEVQLLYRRPQFLWPVCLLVIYWLSRTVLIANRGQLHDDPIMFAVRDRASWITGLAFAILLYAAS